MQLVENKDENMIESNSTKNEEYESLKELVKVGLEIGIELKEVNEVMEFRKQNSIEDDKDLVYKR